MADYPGIYVRACGVLVEEQFASLDSFSFVKRHRYLIIIIEIYFSMIIKKNITWLLLAKVK